MKPFAQEAEVLRVLLMNGWISGRQVVAWADQQLMENSGIDEDLVELCSMDANKIHDLVQLLIKMANETDKYEALRIALGKAYDSVAAMGAEESVLLAHRLSSIASAHNYNLPSDLRFLICIDDQFDLAADGTVGDLPTVKRDLLENLKPFRDLDPGLDRILHFKA